MPISNPQLNGIDLMSLLTGIGVDASGQQPQSPTEGQEGLTLDAVRPRRSDKFIDQLVGPEAYPGVGDEERRLALLQAITSLAGNIGGAIGSKGRSLAREGSDGLFGGPLNEFRQLLGGAQQRATQREEMEAKRKERTFQEGQRGRLLEQQGREDKEREFNTGVAVDALAGTEEDMGILRGAVDPFLAETDPSNASERSRVESLMADIQQIQRQIRKRAESELEVPDSMIASFEKKRDEILTLTKTKEEYDAETVKGFNDKLDELVNVYEIPEAEARKLLMDSATASMRKAITDADRAEAELRKSRAEATRAESVASLTPSDIDAMNAALAPLGRAIDPSTGKSVRLPATPSGASTDKYLEQLIKDLTDPKNFNIQQLMTDPEALVTAQDIPILDRANIAGKAVGDKLTPEERALLRKTASMNPYGGASLGGLSPAQQKAIDAFRSTQPKYHAASDENIIDMLKRASKWPE